MQNFHSDEYLAVDEIIESETNELYDFISNEVKMVNYDWNRMYIGTFFNEHKVAKVWFESCKSIILGDGNTLIETRGGYYCKAYLLPLSYFDSVGI